MAHLSLGNLGMPATRLVCCFLLVLFGPGVAEAPNAKVSPASVDSSTSVDVPDRREDTAIRLEDRLIHVRVTAERLRLRSDRPARQFRPPPRNDTTTLASRARRVFFGDGAYRPQPFPRPTRN